jgi:glutamate-1-semialdehyde aminotransferase
MWDKKYKQGQTASWIARPMKNVGSVTFIRHRLYLPCSQFEAAFLSAAHSEKHVEQTLAAAREALSQV